MGKIDNTLKTFLKRKLRKSVRRPVSRLIKKDNIQKSTIRTIFAVAARQHLTRETLTLDKVTELLRKAQQPKQFKRKQVTPYVCYTATLIGKYGSGKGVTTPVYSHKEIIVYH